MGKYLERPCSLSSKRQLIRKYTQYDSAMRRQLCCGRRPVENGDVGSIRPPGSGGWKPNVGIEI